MSIMLALVIFIWMTKPDWDNLKSEKSNLETLEKETQEIDSQLQSLDAAYSQFSKIGEDKTLIENVIPSFEKPDELIAEYYLKAKESEVFVVSAKKDEAAASSSCKEAMEIPAVEDLESETPGFSALAPCLQSSNVSLTLAGTYLNLKKFIGQIEKMNRLTMAKDFSITKGASEEQGDILTMAVSFEVFTKSAPTGFSIASGLSTPTGKALLAGKIDKGVIDQYKQTVTDKIFQPVGVEGAGKEDIFK